MGPRERAIVVAAIITAVGAVLASFIYVVGPKLLPIQATSSTLISVGDQTQTPVSTQPPVVTQPVNTTGGGCFGGNNYQMPRVLSGNHYFRVEFYTPGNLEHESWLSPGTWRVADGVDGWVWEFPPTCTATDLRADANSAATRRGTHSAGEVDPSDPIVTSAFTKQ